MTCVAGDQFIDFDLFLNTGGNFFEGELYFNPEVGAFVDPSP